MSTLRNKVIRLAHAKPELRPHLLPLVSTGKQAGGPDIDNEMVIQDSRRGYEVSCEGAYIGEFRDWDDAWDAAQEWMKDNKYWPNIYHVNERGNVTLLDAKGDEIDSWV